MKIDDAIKVFDRCGGVLRTKEALDLGVHPRTLYQMRDEGILEAISRGVYRLTSLPPLANPDFVTVALRVPQAVICLNSALSYYDVSDDVPHEVHIALPRGSKKPQLDYPPIQVHQFGVDTFGAGIDVVQIDGVPVQIYNLARTVVDCFRYRNVLGTDVAVKALKEALTRDGVNFGEILKYARICRVETSILPYLEALL